MIFCSKPRIVSEYVIDHSCFQTCHHNLIFKKISANMSLYPSRQVWDYKNVNIKGMQKPISLLFWKKAFENLWIHEKFVLLRAFAVWISFIVIRRIYVLNFNNDAFYFIIFPRHISSNQYMSCTMFWIFTSIKTTTFGMSI